MLYGLFRPVLEYRKLLNVVKSLDLPQVFDVEDLFIEIKLAQAQAHSVILKGLNCGRSFLLVLEGPFPKSLVFLELR